MNTSQNTRITLIERVQSQHDETSWEHFVEIYKGFIYAIIHKMNISSHDADDLTQQVLITLWKKLPETDLKKIVRFRSWIAAITRNHVLNFIKKRKADALRLEKASQDENLTYLDSIRLPEIEAIAETQWKIHLMNLALENVRPKFTGHAMAVFELSMQGLPRAEIAEKLGIQERSIYRLKNRVISRLAEEIETLRTELEP
jgi:RNA polymerase sigma factor (sigma-70 family)